LSGRSLAVVNGDSIKALGVSLPARDRALALAGELAQVPWRPRVVPISSDRDAASRTELDPLGAAVVIPKDELTDTALRTAFGVP
jgi:hypothetical protein